ncbi:ABC transporter substrate-binding protein [Halanaerobium kushneri]|uniref:Raffinose/stachyose/melibiose transport system substrate-binding protein n=1 Tax=Halanaerobium kushneri TaxID=56779 RepID=A0A1N6RXD6_9FIRM|nr:extracellular solute-binding protein [Halanaerobium kushneri]SIQ33491.1 raffinose/stachyose/melibiose transport system substrate-binding protein [Halanaerobium kushneri]
MKKLISLMLVLAVVTALLPGFSLAVSAQDQVEEVELKVFMSFPRFRDHFEEYFAEFREQEMREKNIDVKIKLEMPNPQNAEQILKTRLASNDAPDIFTLHAMADIPTFYEAGYLTDLSDEPFVDTLYESVKRTVTYDNKVVALPLESLAWGYLYNKEIFNELNLTPPQTLAEMKETIEVLKSNDHTPFLLSFKESWIPQLMMALSLGGVVNSEYPDFVVDMNNNQASYADVIEVFNIIDLIMENGTKKPFEVGSTAGSADFANGRAAMWVQGPWMAGSILEANPEMEIGVAPLPVSNNPEGTMINLSTSTSLAVSKNSKQKEVAYDLLNFILDQEKSSELFEKLKFNPISTVHDYQSFPWVEEAMSYASKGRAYQDLSIPGGVTDETAKLLQSYYVETVSKEEIIKSLDKAWKDSISK